MKNLILLILFLVGLSTQSFSQKTYYNPSNKVDLTITIRESYKPVDYGKIGRDFNTMIQNEVQRRENLKRFYDEIYYLTKNSIYSGTVLTPDDLVNRKILMVQSKVINELDDYNRLLKSGMMKPNEYESSVKNIFYNYINFNKVFLQIVQYKYNKNFELVDESKIQEHDKNYNLTINSIVGFEISNSGNIEFKLSNLLYPGKSSSSLLDFVRSSSEGMFQVYYRNFYDKQEKEERIFEEQYKKEQEEKLKNKEEFEKNNEYRINTFNLRKSILTGLSEREISEFRKKEKDYYIKRIENSYLKSGVEIKSKITKSVYENFFTVENENSQFVRFFRLNGKDPFKDPDLKTKFRPYLEFVMEFCENYKK